MLLRGDDGHGNVVLGDQALDRGPGHTPSMFTLDAPGPRYAAMARATQAGEQVGCR